MMPRDQESNCKLTNPAPAAIAPPITIHLVKLFGDSGGGVEDEAVEFDEAGGAFDEVVSGCACFGGHSSVFSSFKTFCCRFCDFF